MDKLYCLTICLGVLGFAGGREAGRPCCDDAQADGDKAKIKKDDTTELQGTWTYEAQVIGGEELSRDERGEIWVEIRGRSFHRCGSGGARLTSKLILHPAQRPRAFDLEFTHPRTGKVSVSKGIYELKGDVLKLCYDNSGKDRPMRFESKKDAPSVVLSVLKRGAAK
jgi:uncharacterized protein (TIGR03067 family)